MTSHIAAMSQLESQLKTIRLHFALAVLMTIGAYLYPFVGTGYVALILFTIVLFTSRNVRNARSDKHPDHQKQLWMYYVSLILVAGYVMYYLYVTIGLTLKIINLKLVL